MYRRGEIYYITIPQQTGTEIAKDRPGVIVSSDRDNSAYGHVMVAYLSSRCRYDRLEHVTIRATGRNSTVLCEQIYTVDKSRIREFQGVCSKQEMDRIDAAILMALDIDSAGTAQLDRISRLEGEVEAYRRMLGAVT